MKLIPHCLTAALWSSAIRSLVDFGNRVRPLGHPVLYRRMRTGDAAPQCISGRTSYLRVRLAFHPYPQLIRAVFNRHRFGRPRGNHPRFPLAMGRSRGFGPAPGHHHALFGLAFALAPLLNRLTNTTKSNSPAHSAKGTPSPPRRAAPTACGRTGFRFCFTPLPGFFSPFPHGTRPLSVAERI